MLPKKDWAVHVFAFVKFIKQYIIYEENTKEIHINYLINIEFVLIYTNFKF